jgi:HK97 family phage major capsid protein
MKRTFLQLGATLPQITSRRLGLKAGSNHNVAYRSNGSDDDDDDDTGLEARLLKLQNALKKSLSREQKEQLEESIADIHEAMEKKMAKVNANLIEDVKTATATLIEIKTANEATKTQLKEAADKAALLEKELNEQKEINTKNQPVIDAFVKNGEKKPAELKNRTFEEVLYDTLMEKSDDIAKFERKEKGHERLVIELKAVGDMSTANVTGGSRYGQQFAPNIMANPYRKVHVRDLLPVRSAGPGNSFTFMKENGAGEGAITTVAETGTKPQFDLDLIEATVNFETIAGWTRFTRKAMRNIPGFVAWLQQRLPELLLKVEDEQLLYGNGSTPNIKGIGTAGNFTAADSSSTNIEDALIDGLSQMEDLLERYPDGIVVRPRVYYNFFKNKATSSGMYDLPKNYVFTNGTLYISGVPVLPTTAVHSGDYFIGDWKNGAALLVQEGMKLEFFEQDSDNVTKNKITARIEETIAFPVYGNDYFVKGNDATES